MEYWGMDSKLNTNEGKRKIEIRMMNDEF